MSDVLVNHEAGGVLTLTFNRPDRLNALDEELTVALIDALGDAHERNSVRCVVLVGMGRGFCVGQDLRAYAEHKKRDESFSVREYMRRGYNVIAMRLRTLEKPVIARINGAAAGAGLSIALACDVRIASEDSRFTLGFSKIGLIPDCGASYLLPLVVGLGRAFELAYTSESIDAHEALRIGLVNRVVPAAELGDAVAAFTAAVLERPARGLALTKRAFNRAMLSGFEEWLEAEALLQEDASRSEDHHEALTAFVEKRSPRFSGH